MRSTLMLTLAIALASGAPAAGAPRDSKPASMLSERDLDPATLLPPPPAPGSAQAAAELAELKSIERDRSENEVAAARHDSETKDASIFADAIGPAFDLSRLPATAALMAVVRAAEKDVADRGKAEFQRQRPWIVDGSLKTCERGDAPLSSYPSGHTTMAFSMGAVLARLAPSRAGPIMARAARYGQSRIVCEQHFRSDVTAGEALGLLVAERLAGKPAFALRYAAARTELRRAGVR